MKKEKELKKKRPVTIEEAFQISGRPTVDFSNLPDDLRSYFENLYNGIVITEALNEGRKPDWDNWSEKKWRAWFRMSASAFGLRGTTCATTVSSAGSGSRLVNFDEETAEYSATQFKDVWKEIQIG